MSMSEISHPFSVTDSWTPFHLQGHRKDSHLLFAPVSPSQPAVLLPPHWIFSCLHLCLEWVATTTHPPCRFDLSDTKSFLFIFFFFFLLRVSARLAPRCNYSKGGHSRLRGANELWSGNGAEFVILGWLAAARSACVLNKHQRKMIYGFLWLGDRQNWSLTPLVLRNWLSASLSSPSLGVKARLEMCNVCFAGRGVTPRRSVAKPCVASGVEIFYRRCN